MIQDVETPEDVRVVIKDYDVDGCLDANGEYDENYDIREDKHGAEYLYAEH